MIIFVVKRNYVREKNTFWYRLRDKNSHGSHGRKVEKLYYYRNVPANCIGCSRMPIPAWLINNWRNLKSTALSRRKYMPYFRLIPNIRSRRRAKHLSLSLTSWKNGGIFSARRWKRFLRQRGASNLRNLCRGAWLWLWKHLSKSLSVNQ